MRDSAIVVIRRYLSWMPTDALLVALAFYTAFLFRFVSAPGRNLAQYLGPLNSVIVLLMLLYVVMNVLTQLDNRLWAYATVQDVGAIFVSVGMSTFVVVLVDLLYGATYPRLLPLSVVVLG